MQKFICGLLLLLLSCAPVPYDGPLPGNEESTRQPDILMLTYKGEKIRVLAKGLASYTADEIEGKKTASGEIYHMRQLVAAHPTLPFNTIVRVKNLANNKTVDVRVNDRGPFVQGRIIDVSFEAAKRLDFIQRGTTTVELQIVKLPK